MTREETIREVVRCLVEYYEPQRVFARALAEGQMRGEPGRELLRFAGFIDAESVREMAEAIEAGCEQIEADGW